MKQIFDWLREQMQEEPKRLRKMKNQCISLCDREVLEIEEKAYGFYRQCINEAEAKWGCHAICYLDSPCEYQNEDIRVDEADCCEWEHRENYVNCLCKCNGIMVEHDWAIGFKFCPYCGKPIKILGVE